MLFLDKAAKTVKSRCVRVRVRVVSCAVRACAKVRLSVFTLVCFNSPTSFLSSLCVSLLE